jgi:glutathione S-transferase
MPSLHTSPGSPFGRKARIAIHHLSLEDKVQVVPAQTSNPEDPIHDINPLRKMPALVTDERMAIYDSPVILDYLDWLAGGGRIVPAEPAARFEALTLQALADGFAEAVVAIRYESRWHEPDHMSQTWIAHQQKKVDGALAALNRQPPARREIDVGQIALACALGFYEKHAGEGWAASCPRLRDWLLSFEARVPAYRQTAG